MLRCKDDVDTLMRRWLAPRRPGSAACADLERHTLVSYALGRLDAQGVPVDSRARPARADARHLIVRERGRPHYDGTPMVYEAFAVDRLAELRAVGAQALPLVPGTLPGEEDLAYRASVAEIVRAAALRARQGTPMSGSGTPQEALERTRAFLLRQRGACALVARAEIEDAKVTPYRDITL